MRVRVSEVKLLIESMFDGVIRSEGTIVKDGGRGSDLPIDGLKRLLLTYVTQKHRGDFSKGQNCLISPTSYRIF